MKQPRGCWIATGLLGLLAIALIVVLAVLAFIAIPGSFGLPGNAVAVVYIEGPIVMGNAGSGGGQSAYSETLVRDLQAVANNSDVRAVVLRIESPGGSVVASREIYDAVLALRAKGKPVVASMGEVAASGGYYVAAAADKIYAEPATMTGSIGVISVLPNMEGLADKVGVKMVIVKSGAHKDESYGLRDLSDEERQIWQQVIDEAYEDFAGVVAAGRHMDIAAVKKLADGRIYTGKQAKENGLVDELATLDEAINAAAKMANISGTPRTIKYRQRPGLFESLASSIQPSPARDLVDLFAMRQWGRVLYLYVAP
jgi:protease-4